MCCKLSILCLIVVFPLVLSAQQSDFEIQLVNDSSIRLEPGITSNIVIKLVNNTSHNHQVSLKINNPHGWKCFSGLKDIKTPAFQSTIKILSFRIPANELAGEYFIYIEVFDSLENKIAVSNVPVTIKQKFELNVELIKTQEYVFAGDTLSVQFMLQNLSNSITEIEAIPTGSTKDEKMRFLLKPDSTVFITTKIKTEKGILRYIQKNISLTASLVNMPDVKASKYHSYKVIPSRDIKYDPYNRFPIQFSTLFVTDNPAGVRLYAVMFDIAGRGFLDDKHSKAISFHFQGPNRNGKPLYGYYDEYWVEYFSPKAKYLLGDNTYSLSYLTEFSRYGRGAEAEHYFRNFKVGSWITYPRFFPDIRREIAAYASFSASKKLVLNLGYLNKLSITEDVAHLLTFNGTSNLFKWVKFDWEYAVGSFGNEYKQAIRTELSLNYKAIRLTYNYTMAEKDFPGYFTDTRYMLANLNVRLLRKLSVSTNYRYNHQNMALDTLYGIAPFSESFSFSISYLLMKDGGLSASYYLISRQDRMEPMKFHYSENLVRLDLFKRLNKFKFDIMGEYGNTENFLLPENERFNKSYQGRLTLSFLFSNKFNINAYVNYQDNKRYLVYDDKNWVYSASVNAMVNEKIRLSVNYQSSYSIEDYSYDRNILSGYVHYSPNNINKFEISSRYSLVKNSLDQKELSFLVRYTRKINVPMRKKKNIGKLSGKIINNGVKSIEGIVVTLGDEQAVTDENGNYSFPILPAGNYYLMLDYTSAGVNAIPEIPSPYQVEVLPRRETKFDISLTKEANITGEIVIVKEATDDKNKFAEIRNQLGKLLIEAKKGDEVFRVLTNEDFEFSFEGLRPGMWTVKVYNRGISNEYELVTDLFNLNIAPGQNEHIEVKIKEKRRRIKFQKIKQQ